MHRSSDVTGVTNVIACTDVMSSLIVYSLMNTIVSSHELCVEVSQKLLVFNSLTNRVDDVTLFCSS